IYEELRLSGYQGGYDAIRRYGRSWERRQAIKQAEAYVIARQSGREVRGNLDENLVPRFL
ncbi:MAG TPA: hypothetical protein VKN76_16110, partial [Kiloniellaceae bacterium]|nr:hypothetical protein [Kiloniellaceae bacterium]